LISLLDPSAIPDPQFKEYSAYDIKDFFLMRFKEDIRKEAGEMLSDRQVIPRAQTTGDASQSEEDIYGILAKMRDLWCRPMQGPSEEAARSKHTALLEYGFYKLFLSSPEACWKTVEKRLKNLGAEDAQTEEIQMLQELSNKLAVLSLKESTRYRILKDQLAAIGWDGSPASPRLLIFTEYRGTQEALAAALARDFSVDYSEKFEAQSDQVISVIHGSTPDIHLMRAVEAFATGNAPVRLMIATDVASEGINLHHECHHIIHYDLPWSIITLIQRNGRIDRLGQTQSPVLRYLIVNTSQGLLKGDQEIFNRLIDKVEEINRLRQSGESVLKLYDADAEEEYIATKGILAGNKDILEKPAAETDGSIATGEALELEQLLTEAGQAGHEDFVKFLLGASDEVTPAPEKEQAPVAPLAGSERFRLYSDRRFFTEGYQFLAETNPGYLSLQTSDKTVVLTPPPDLQRRLGKGGSREEVIFGATAIPMEAWPENDQFRLTDNPAQVELAIKAARNTAGYWSRELLCSEQLLILQWLTERLLMTVDRGQAPIILSRYIKPGELCFCFIGQVSSKSGVPLIVDGHSVSFLKGEQHPVLRPLKEALELVQFDRLINTGAQPNTLAAQPLVHAAVPASIKHMAELKVKRDKQMTPLLRKEEHRLRLWRDSRERLLKQRITECGEHSEKGKRIKKAIDEMNDYVKDRGKNWRDTHFLADEHPSTRLIIVIQGAE
jgi:hypothetical protein